MKTLTIILGWEKTEMQLGIDAETAEEAFEQWEGVKKKFLETIQTEQNANPDQNRQTLGGQASGDY